MAHAEGRLVTPSAESTDQLFEDEVVALTYDPNFNGSSRAIAGLQDKDGRVLGLMPHPERFTERRHHYDSQWAEAEQGWGHYVFASVKKHLNAPPKAARE